MIAQRAPYWICLALVGFETLYGFYWTIPDIGVRLGVWPRNIHPGLYDVIPTLSWWQEFAFFSHVVVSALAFAALWLRWGACFPIFMAAFILDRIDWLAMGLNQNAAIRTMVEGGWMSVMAYFGGFGVTGYLQCISLILMIYLLQTGEITMKLPAALAKRLGR